MIKSKTLAKALFELIEDGVPNVEDKFLSFMRKNKLESQISSVLYRLDKIIEQDRERKGIQIEVPHELTENTKIEIKRFLQAEKLQDYVKFRKELIAGFRAKWEGKLYDASMATSLKKLQETIIK